eukprot:m.46823 g.46823  ORF g.46823 m.46823 type:complete len:1292 (-) comp12280_c2_seq1:52-3927(-)
MSSDQQEFDDTEEPLLSGPRMAPTHQPGSRVASARLSRRARSAAAQRASILEQERGLLDGLESLQQKRPSMHQTRFNTRLEEEWNVSTMEELKTQFYRQHDGVLNSAEFVEALREYTKQKGAESYLRDLFDKIDGANQGAITWDEFATYMLLEYQKKADTYTRSKKVSMTVPAKGAAFPTRSPCARIQLNGQHQAIVMQENGTLSFWSNECTNLRTYTLSLDSRRKATWCTDACLLEKQGTLVVASGERELWFFNFSTMEPFFVITQLEDTPLRLDTTYSEAEKSAILLIGDHQGCLVALHLPDGYMESPKFKSSLSRRKLYGEILRIPMEAFRSAKQQYGGIFFTRWAAHSDWVTCLMYCENLRMIISACNEEDSALVVGEILQPALQEPKSYRIDPQGPSSQYFHQGSGVRKNLTQTVFRVRKGVRTLAYIEKGNLIATGGLDRAIWLWNPYVTFQAAGVLRGHTAPIHHICASTTDHRLFSLSVDYQLMVWDTIDLTCLSSISRRRHKMMGDPSALFFFPAASSLVIPADQLFSIHMQQKTQRKDEVLTHHAAVVSSIYNSRFKHIVTGSRDGTIKVWTVGGDQVFEFSVLDDGQTGDASVALTTMVFDSSMRRLITGQVNGAIKAWNYGNGQLLRLFDKRSDKEVTSMVYLEHGMLKRIAVTGWDRRVFMFKDLPEDDLHVAPVHPMPSRAAVKYHSDDVQALCFCPPNTLVTSSYDGQLKMWNVTSISVTGSMHIPQPKAQHPRRRSQRRLTSSSPRVEQMLEERNLPHLACLSARPLEPEVATLVACGCHGHIYFFSLLQGGRLISWFTVNATKDVTITRAKPTKSNNHLIVGDSDGWIRVFDISEYACGKDSLTPEAESSPAVPSNSRNPDLEATDPANQEQVTPTRKPFDVADELSSIPEESPDGAFGPAAQRRGTENDDKWGNLATLRKQRPKAPLSRDSSRATLFDDAEPQEPAANSGPPLVASWRAHLDGITNIELIQDPQLLGETECVIITTSKDHRCRMWGLKGEFISTFGQEDAWDLLDPGTWEHPERPPEIVRFEESEAQRKQEEEAMQKEMLELGIYDDDVDEYEGESDDEDNLRAQTPYQSRLKLGLGQTSRPGSRFTGNRARSGRLGKKEAFTWSRRSSTTNTTTATQGLPFGASFSRTSLSMPAQRLSVSTQDKTMHRNTSDSIFDLRHTPLEMSRLPTQLDTSVRQSAPPGRARKASQQRELTREASTPAFKRLAGRASGNWERHLQTIPHRLPSEQVYLCLPYHRLSNVTIPAKPQYQDDTSFLVEQLKR